VTSFASGFGCHDNNEFFLSQWSFISSGSPPATRMGEEPHDHAVVCGRLTQRAFAAEKCPLVLFLFSEQAFAMPPLPPQPKPVTFEEVAEILDEAAVQARGGPPYLIPAAGWHLASALNAAGFWVIRVPTDGRQLTL
jgi:hypothetical protein